MTAQTSAAVDRIHAPKVMRRSRTLLKIVFIGTVIVSAIFYVLRLPSLEYEKYSLYVSSSTEVGTSENGSSASNTATLRRATIPLKKRHQATELRAKFFIAFAFGDQLTRATENLLALAALARYGNRSVAVPFVKDSMFHGTKIHQNAGTLSRYFDLNVLNQKLDSYGYGLLKGWRHFQQSCNQSLGVLVNVLTLDGGSNAHLSNIQEQLLKKTGWTPCISDQQQTGDRFKGFNVNQTICIDPEILRSLQQLESDVLRGSSCVGFVSWRGVGTGRCHFNLSSDKIPSPLSVRPEVPFSRKLVQVAQDYALRQLGNNYISVHIRSEWVLRRHKSNITYLLNCFRQLSSRIQSTKQKTSLEKIFLATDFSTFGSKSYTIRPAREKSEMLHKYLDKMLENHHVFDPRTVELSDRGSIAIVEMNILSAGKKLFLVGGGNFEDWIKDKFEKVSDYAAEKICYRERP